MYVLLVSQLSVAYLPPLFFSRCHTDLTAFCQHLKYKMWKNLPTRPNCKNKIKKIRLLNKGRGYVRGEIEIT